MTTTRAAIDRLEILVTNNDVLAERIGKDLATHLGLVPRRGTVATEVFDTLSGERTRKGLSREIVKVLAGIVREMAL